MRKKASTLVLATSLGLGGLATGVVLAPAMATAATSDTTTTAAVADRVSKIKEALSGLVTDGTLTQAEADKVATTLAEKLPARGPGGPGGHGRGFGRGPGLEAAAEAIGITVEELHTQLHAGKTLAQIAEAEGVSKATLIDKLVTAAEAKLAEAVTSGRLTQAEADAKKADLRARITEQVDRVHPARGPRGEKGEPSTTTPAPAATTSSSA